MGWDVLSDLGGWVDAKPVIRCKIAKAMTGEEKMG